MTDSLSFQIQRLQEELDLPPLEKTEEGGYLWPLGPDSSILITENEEEYLFFSSFAPLPKEGNEIFFTKMLRANLFGQGTSSGTLGLNAEGNRLLLQKEASKDIDYESFVEILSEFITTIEVWQDESLQPSQELES